MWRTVEDKTYEILSKRVKVTQGLEIIQAGGSNSHESDIQVFLYGEHVYNIQVKMPVAQTSQFVLDITDGVFGFSSLNISVSNHISDSIIAFLNEHQSTFLDVSQSSIDIPIHKNIIFDWVINNLTEKKNKYICVNDNNKLFLYNMLDIQDVFDIKAVLRRKKSGSRNLAAKWLDDFIETYNTSQNKATMSINKSGKRFILTTNKVLDTLYLYSQTSGNTYYLSTNSDKSYNIKILGTTNNPTVLFTIKHNDHNSKNQLTDWLNNPI